MRGKKRRFHKIFLISVLYFLSSPLAVHSAAAKEPTAYQRALSAYEERRLDEAYSLAKRAVRETPKDSNAHLLLGQLHYLRQEMKQAQVRWKKALELAPNRQDIQTQLDRLEREMAVEEDLTRGDTHPFVVRFAQHQVPVHLGVLKDILRDVHRQVGQQLQYFPSHQITVLLYPEEDFAQVKTLSHRTAGLYDGKIRLPLKAHGGMDVREFKRILWHEYTHALVHDLAKGRCPVWLNEGIATLQEESVAPVSVGLVRRAFEKELLPSWETLWQSSYEAETLELNYQTAYLLVTYLVKRWSWGKLKDLLEHLGGGADIRQALEATYRQDPESLEAEWRRWLKRKL